MRGMTRLTNFVLFGLVNGLTLSPRAERTLDIPSSPPSGHQPIAANFVSYSIEFSYMLDYAGSLDKPNRLSQRMVQNIASRAGAFPILRAGGSTQNRAIYFENQTEPVILHFSTPGADQPSGLTIGPRWVEAFQTMPEGTKFVYGLSFFDKADPMINGTDGIDQTVAQAQITWNAFGDDIEAWEIGNEVNGFPGGRRPADWDVHDYAAQWNEYAEAVIAATGAPKEIFQAGAFTAPRTIGDDSHMTAETAINAGIDENGFVKDIADHDYMGAICEGSPTPTLEGNLLNHHRMTSLMYWHEYLGNYSAEHNIDYVIGETNSISCQGAAGISDVLGAAVWSVDYVMYVASVVKASRMYFHMGTPYRYSAWQPIDIEVNGTTVPSGPKPLYYGNLLAADAFKGGEKTVRVLINETRFTGYALYDSKLSDVVLVNLNTFNSTQSTSERGVTEVNLGLGNDVVGKVRRLTGRGVDVATNITYAGKTVAADGTFKGEETVEEVVDGVVQVRDGEAVLVSF